MLATQRSKANDPYKWRGGDTSTFSQQAQNLSNLGDQGLNTSIVDVQKQTAEAQQKAAKSAQNAAQGASKVAGGAEVTPVVAQDPANPTIQPYQVTKEAPAAPNTDVKTAPDFAKDSTFKDPTLKYLETLFPGGLPPSIQDKLNKSLQNKDQIGHIQDDFQSYLNDLGKGIQNSTPNDVQQYKNALQNQLQEQLQNIQKTYGNSQTDLAKQNTEKQKAISEYIDKLQTGLKNYQKGTQDLGNTGQLSEAEQESAAKNAVLGGKNVSGIAALSALSQNGAGDTRLAALTQQAQNAAIQDAEGKATANQELAKNAANAQAEGKKAQNTAYTEAGNTITKNQTSQFKKLQESSDAAQQALADAYNNSTTTLSKEGHDYVEKAQDTLKNAKVPPSAVKSATVAFADSVQKYLKDNLKNMSDDDKSDLTSQLEGIWRIAAGSGNNDINFSHDIAGTLIPILQTLKPNVTFELGNSSNWGDSIRDSKSNG